MDDTQRIVKCGNLSLHTAGGFFKKKWHAKYLVLYDGSKSGVKRLELFDSEIKFKKQNAAKIIPLVDCVRVVTCQRNKTTYTFEVRTSEQFYLLAAQSFQDMTDWVNCLRLVAFGEAPSAKQQPRPHGQFNVVSPAHQQQQQRLQPANAAVCDVLLDKRNPKPAPIAGSSASSSSPASALQQNPSGASQQPARCPTTASQALAAASSALAKTRQRQPSLLGACKPQPPTDSPFIQQQQQQVASPALATNSEQQQLAAIGGQIDTLTPTVRGQLIGGNQLLVAAARSSARMDDEKPAALRPRAEAGPAAGAPKRTPALRMAEPALDEEEENMLYCSIEDNPSEHNYRVKVIESELSLRCQLKCYQLTSPTAISQQYDQIGNFNRPGAGREPPPAAAPFEPVTFYQLIVGPQELTLLNDYAPISGGTLAASRQQQGLWSWPYQCVRRYGFDKDNCFMFEAGRKCGSGPGQFIVQTPKAYSIYQDVVKFVNELRCVGGGIGELQQQQQQQQQQQSLLPLAGQLPGVAAQDQPEQPAKADNAVTQIPVSWAPVECPDSRKHFFDSLQQMGAATKSQQQQHQEQQQPNNGQNYRCTNSSSNEKSTGPQRSQPQPNYPPPNFNLVHRNPMTIPELCEQTSSSESSASSSASSSSASSLTKNSSAKDSLGPLGATKRGQSHDVTSEETDESGYEQGDDSVDSASSRCRSSTNELKERHSISSASSISSSNEGGSGGRTAPPGPLYSVIQKPRQSRESCNTSQVQHKQSAPLSRRWPPLKPTDVKPRQEFVGANMRTSNTEKLLSRLIADGSTARQDHDFETSLIRDVYSEITKLHATFAVTPYSE